MASVTLAGNPITVAGNFPKKGDSAPDFTLTAKDLKEVGLKDYAGKRKVLNIVPSLDTPVCQASTRKFNAEATKLGNTVCWSLPPIYRLQWGVSAVQKA